MWIRAGSEDASSSAATTPMASPGGADPTINDAVGSPSTADSLTREDGNTSMTLSQPRDDTCLPADLSKEISAGPDDSVGDDNDDVARWLPTVEHPGSMQPYATTEGIHQPAMSAASGMSLGLTDTAIVAYQSFTVTSNFLSMPHALAASQLNPTTGLPPPYYTSGESDVDAMLSERTARAQVGYTSFGGRTVPLRIIMNQHPNASTCVLATRSAPTQRERHPPPPYTAPEQNNRAATTNATSEPLRQWQHDPYAGNRAQSQAVGTQWRPDLSPAPSLRLFEVAYSQLIPLFGIDPPPRRNDEALVRLGSINIDCHPAMITQLVAIVSGMKPFRTTMLNRGLGLAKVFLTPSETRETKCLFTQRVVEAMNERVWMGPHCVAFVRHSDDIGLLHEYMGHTRRHNHEGIRSPSRLVTAVPWVPHALLNSERSTPPIGLVTHGNNSQ